MRFFLPVCGAFAGLQKERCGVRTRRVRQGVHGGPAQVLVAGLQVLHDARDRCSVVQQAEGLDQMHHAGRRRLVKRLANSPDGLRGADLDQHRNRRITEPRDLQQGCDGRHARCIGHEPQLSQEKRLGVGVAHLGQRIQQPRPHGGANSVVCVRGGGAQNHAVKREPDGCVPALRRRLQLFRQVDDAGATAVEQGVNDTTPRSWIRPLQGADINFRRRARRSGR